MEGEKHFHESLSPYPSPLLQAADTPFLDSIAAAGLNGLMARWFRFRAPVCQNQLSLAPSVQNCFADSPQRRDAPTKICFQTHAWSARARRSERSDKQPRPVLLPCACGAPERVSFPRRQDPVEPGLACGSDTAHMSILGYDPMKLYRGRGAFESLGAGAQRTAKQGEQHSQWSAAASLDNP